MLQTKSVRREVFTTKETIRGARGKVKTPSDFLSRKEREALNGEVKSYRMNEPIQWAEFKAMPDDIKAMYIKALRNKYGVPDKEISMMMGTAKSSFSYTMKKIDCASGCKNSKRSWDKNGWEKWLHGIKDALPVEDQTVEEVGSLACNPAPETVTEDSAQIDYSEVVALHERVKQLEAENAILEAKLSMVYLFFGKEQT